MPVLNDVVFAYVQLQTPKKKYQSEETEYSLNAVVSKDAAKAWNKEYSKQKAKVVDTSDFSEAYKIDAPFPDQDEQFILTFKAPTHYRDGNKVAEDRLPKVFEKLANGKLKNVTKSKLVANGSIGAVEFNVISNDYGTFAQLKNIRVDELIEYISASGTSLGDVVEEDEGSELGNDYGDSLGHEEESTKPVKKSKAKTAVKVEPSEEEEDTQLPW